MSNYTPRELFIEESKHLISVKPRSSIQKTIYAVTNKTTVFFEQNEYALPKEKVSTGNKVRVEVYDQSIIFYCLANNEFLCKHKLLEGIGGVVIYDSPTMPTTKDEEIRRAFNDNPDVARFLKHLKESDSRYFLAKCARPNKIQKYYSTEIILNAI